jgi:hypothetical protein
VLERQSGGVIPHRQGTIVGCWSAVTRPPSLTSREHDAFLVDTERVDDGLVADKVVNKDALGALPLFDAVVV